MASNGIILMKQLVTKKAPSFPVTESECTLKICMCIVVVVLLLTPVYMYCTKLHTITMMPSTILY